MNLTQEEYAAMVKRVRGTAQRSAMTNWKDSPEAMTSPMRKVSGSNINPRLAPSPHFRSKWEEQMAYELTLEKRALLIKDFGYETMTLKLAKGKRYTPDFIIEHVNGRIECLEIKGHHKNLRDSLTHVKWAAQKHPWFRFTIKRRTGRGWESERVEA
jgi:hypothetical protein